VAALILGSAAIIISKRENTIMNIKLLLSITALFLVSCGGEKKADSTDDGILNKWYEIYEIKSSAGDGEEKIEIIQSAADFRDLNYGLTTAIKFGGSEIKQRFYFRDITGDEYCEVAVKAESHSIGENKYTYYVKEKVSERCKVKVEGKDMIMFAKVDKFESTLERLDSQSIVMKTTENLTGISVDIETTLILTDPAEGPMLANLKGKTRNVASDEVKSIPLPFSGSIIRN
jgi:hypothetical protein